MVIRKLLSTGMEIYFKVQIFRNKEQDQNPIGKCHVLPH
jgi:hypothetical protein